MRIVSFFALSIVSAAGLAHLLPTDSERANACHVLCGETGHSSVEPQAAHPNCKDSDSDPDGDGFGWENGVTCLVTAMTPQLPPTPSPQPRPTPTPKTSESVSGWASTGSCGTNGTVGGGNAPTVTVSSISALKTQMQGPGAKVILLSGQFDTGSDVHRITGAVNKTLVGTPGTVITGGIRMRRARNLIVRNIEFVGKHGIGFDAFELTESTCVWLDHNTFRDGRDGNLDIVRGSDYITVSWSRFYYTDGFDHMFSNLQGGSNNNPQDLGKLKVTYHHNWFGAGVNSRMPRVRYGETHIYNNYYRYEKVPGDRGQSYAIGAGQFSSLLVENNFFDGTRNPVVWISEGGTATVVHRGNIFSGTSGTTVSRGISFEPPYRYTLDKTEHIPSLVKARAGVYR